MELHPDCTYLGLWYADAPSVEVSQARRLKRGNMMGMVWYDPEGRLTLGVRFRYYGTGPEGQDEYSGYTYRAKATNQGVTDKICEFFDKLFAGCAHHNASFWHKWPLDCKGAEVIERMEEGKIGDMALIKIASPDEIRRFAAVLEEHGKEVDDLGDFFKRGQ